MVVDSTVSYLCRAVVEVRAHAKLCDLFACIFSCVDPFVIIIVIEHAAAAVMTIPFQGWVRCFRYLAWLSHAIIAPS